MSWLVSFVGVVVVIWVGWRLYSARRSRRTLEPWPWPPDFRATAEDMARPIDPTPDRVLPPDDVSMVSQVATTQDALSRLIADKPPAWTWAIFTSVLVQRRNALLPRLRRCASGYQPRTGPAPLTGREYSWRANRGLETVADTVAEFEQFMLSPGFTGAFGGSFAGKHNGAGAERYPDADAIVAVAHRLMDYHEAFLGQAEACLQVPVERDALPFVQDVGAFTLCPLIGYERFISTMCARVGEAQDLLPYTKAGSIIELDYVGLEIDLPDGLMEHIGAHFNRFAD